MDDPKSILKQLFVNVTQKPAIDAGQSPAQRAVFRKTHGIAHGWFEPLADLPESLREGVFALPRTGVWVRFSSDASPASSDLANSTVGIGVKLFGVPGPKLMGTGDTQDFLLQNHDVFFVDTAQDMAEFTKAGIVGGGYAAYREAHPVTDGVMNDMQKVELSVLSASYWSGLPYAFGKAKCVKYKLVSDLKTGGVAPDDPNYLAADLACRLRAGEARFGFFVQFMTDPEKTPLDRATVRWNESDSPLVKVATLVLARQDIGAPGQASYGENLAFNPWHCLEAHAPQGSLAEARRVVYAGSADLRRNANGISVAEPGEIRGGLSIAGDSEEDTQIVRAAIYPPIGVARVGNSQDEFFIGPEVAAPIPQPSGFYRDAQGALKREAARFRIYGLNAEGKAVAELNASNAEIAWTVHVANKKASWYQFQLAMDIPESASAPFTFLRNATITDRAALAIDSRPVKIEGRSQKGRAEHAFNTGSFMGRQVYLGELQTDEEGRLIVLGGRGVSASVNGTRAVTFANNEGWYDDVSDGPVTAEVTWNGQKLNVSPAWVVVAPPNYAPLQKSVRTMWDVMRETAIESRQIPLPVRPSFDREIRPVFERMSALQWVNAGYAAAFGWKGINNLSTPEILARLSRNNPAEREVRRTITNQFRVFDRDSSAQQPWPWLYGDAMNIPPVSPRANTSLTNLQLHMLQQWAAGDFEEDYNPARKDTLHIDDLPVAERPDMLTRAAMEFCLADAFHPGCEMTWPMRRPSLYMAPFRIRQAPADAVEPEYGASLTWGAISDLLPNGPLGPQFPGGLTRWMAVPWQTDTASCQSGYQKSYDPYLPTFWPARVPNQVLTSANYKIVMDGARPLGERLEAFARRASWLRPLGNSYPDQINNMVAHYGEMGVVERRSGPGDPDFPQTMEVESLPTQKHEDLTASASQQPAAKPEELEHTEKARRLVHGLWR